MMGLGQSSGDDEQETRDKDFLTLWQQTQQWHKGIAKVLKYVIEKDGKKLSGSSTGGGSPDCQRLTVSPASN